MNLAWLVPAAAGLIGAGVVLFVIGCLSGIDLWTNFSPSPEGRGVYRLLQVIDDYGDIEVILGICSGAIGTLGLLAKKAVGQ